MWPCEVADVPRWCLALLNYVLGKRDGDVV